MPSKIDTICYVHSITKRLTNEFTIKEVTAMARLDKNDPKAIAFLKVKVFEPINKEEETNIGEFDTGDVIFLKGKFIAHSDYYLVYTPLKKKPKRERNSLTFPS